MPIKTIAFVISTIYGPAHKPTAIYIQPDLQEKRTAHVKVIFQDTLPPLHSLKEEEIVSLTPSFEDQTLKVVLRNGNTYIYKHKDWDYEDYYPSVRDRKSTR